MRGIARSACRCWAWAAEFPVGTTGAMPPAAGAAAATPLARLLCARIRAGGPITYAEWMGAALYEPGRGYYRRGRPTVGPDGDFLTSPELHPLFGAAVGKVAGAVHEALGRPNPLRIVEVGPGTGALAESLLEAVDAPIALTLIEGDEAAVERQRARLAGARAALEWRREIGEAAGGAHLVLANELLDAQPAHRLRFGEEGWSELLVDCGGDGRFCDAPAPVRDARLLAPLRGVAAAPGQIAEVSPARGAIVGSLAGLLGEGLLLLFDYGYPRAQLYDPRRLGGTLMTFRRHAPGEDPYAYAGEQDISCHIDIDQAREAVEAAGLDLRAPRSQAEWLGEIGGGLLEEIEDARARLAARRALEALSDAEGLGRIAVMAATRGAIGELPGLGSVAS